MKDITDNDNMYWNSATDESVLKYRAATTDDERNHIYESQLHTPFTKLAENVSNAFVNTKGYIYQSQEELQSDILTHLLKAISSFDPTRGKGFSFFTIVGKRYLIALNKQGYSHNNKEVSLDTIHDDNEDGYNYLVYKPSDVYLSDDSRFQDKFVDHFKKYAPLYFRNDDSLRICCYVVDIARGLYPVPIRDSTYTRRTRTLSEPTLVKSIRDHCGLHDAKYNTLISRTIKLYFILSQFLLYYYSEHNDIPDKHICITCDEKEYAPSVVFNPKLTCWKLSFADI